MKSKFWFFWFFQQFLVQAIPHSLATDGNLRDDAAGFTARNEDKTKYPGELPRDRTISTIMSLFCIMILSLLLGEQFNSFPLEREERMLTVITGSRIGKLRRSATMKRNITSILVLFLYFVVISFIICSAVMLSGQGLLTYELCFAATWICLIFYTASKGIMYVYTHIVG